MYFKDFKEASDFGKMAEILYEESYCNVFKKKGYIYHYDVRLLRPFQLVDIDFIESKIELDLSDEIKQLDLVCNTGIHTDEKLKNNDYCFVEVKADSRTHETGNAVLEIAQSRNRRDLCEERALRLELRDVRLAHRGVP